MPYDIVRPAGNVVVPLSDGLPFGRPILRALIHVPAKPVNGYLGLARRAGQAMGRFGLLIRLATLTYARWQRRNSRAIEAPIPPLRR